MGGDVTLEIANAPVLIARLVIFRIPCVGCWSERGVLRVGKKERRHLAVGGLASLETARCRHSLGRLTPSSAGMEKRKSLAIRKRAVTICE